MKNEEIKAAIEKVKANKFLPDNIKTIKIAQLETQLTKVTDKALEDDDDSDFEKQFAAAPESIRNMIEKAYPDGDKPGYTTLNKLNKDLKKKGWEIDYDLASEITSLTKIKVSKKIKSKYKVGNKVKMSNDEPVLTITKVNVWEDKSPTYDLKSANGKIIRQNIPEDKISKSGKKISSIEKTKTTHKYKGKTVPELDDKDCDELIKETQERRKKAAVAEKKSKSRPIIEKVTVPIVKAVKKAIENIPAAELKDKPGTELSRIDKAIAATKRYLMELKTILGEDWDKDTVQDELKDLHALSKELHKKYGE